MQHSSLDDSEAIVRSYFILSQILTDFDYHDNSCFTPDGQVFAVISNSDMISLFKCDGCDLLTQIANKKYGCTLSQFHLHNNFMYINSWNEKNDHAARLLDIKTQGFIRYFSSDGHTDHITSLIANNNGLITSGFDTTIKFWDDNQEQCITTIQMGSNCPANISLHPNGICLAATTQNALYIYDIRNLDNVVASKRIDTPNSNLRPQFGMVGNNLFVIGDDFAASYDLTDLSQKYSIPLVMQEGMIPGFSYTHDEQFMLVPTNDFSILIADSLTGSQATVLSGHNSPITSISFSSAYYNFVSTSQECLFWTVDVPTYNLLLNS